MIKLASAGVEGSGVFDATQWMDRKHLESDQWLVGNPTVSNKYEFVGRPNSPMPSMLSHKASRTNLSPELVVSSVTWKDAFDGFCVLAFLAIIFCLSAWIFCHLTVELVPLGNSEIQGFLQQPF